MNDGELGSAEVLFRDFAIEVAQNYQPNEQAAQILRETGVFTVSSMVAGGKGTVCDILKGRDFCEISISHTTRDVEARDRIDPGDPESLPKLRTYHFVDLAHITGKMLAGEMLEAEPIHGNIYGTSLDSLEAVAASGKRPLLEIDVFGVKNLRSFAPEVPSFYICPQPVAEWLGRWAAGDPDVSRDVFEVRVNTAKRECVLALDMVSNDSIVLIDNKNAEVAADSIIAGVEDGIIANQPHRTLALRDFTDEISETSLDTLWSQFQSDHKR